MIKRSHVINHERMTWTCFYYLHLHGQASPFAAAGGSPNGRNPLGQGTAAVGGRGSGDKKGE
ncbi:hypothetical protein B4113_3873 [Geobacillus sp. B4113_201601]|nr:hypothetical protein B4113_3873 [Geobacillus sp. B4113_201601]